MIILCTASMPRIFFCRHGEAAHNPLLVAGNYKAKDPKEMNAALLRQARSIVDPALTEAGRAQAVALGEKLVAEGAQFDICVTSPLARAIETAHLAFGKCTSKFLITPELCETATGPTGLKLAGPQRGVSKAEMLEKHGFISTWDLSYVRDDGEGANWILGEPITPTEEVGGEIGKAWHHPVPIEERLQPLALWLKARPEATVAIVGHSGVFDKLIGKDVSACYPIGDPAEPPAQTARCRQARESPSTLTLALLSSLVSNR